MIHLLTPTIPKFKEDIKTRIDLLEKYISKNLGKGLELKIPLKMVYELKDFKEFKEKSIENLKPYKDNYTIIVHMPLQREDYTNKCTDLSTSEGVETLKKTIDFARSTGAKKVVAHPEVFIYGDDADYKNKYYRTEKVNAIKKNLKNVIRGTYIQICVENMPLPLMGDIKEFSDASKMPYDSIVNTIEDCLDFDSLTMDTCHYNITRRKINSLLKKYGKKLNEEICEKEGIKGIYPGTFSKQPNLLGAFAVLGEKIKHVHFSDSKGIWVPNKSIFYEGIIPGDGEIGVDTIQETLKYIQEGYDSMTITVEVNDKNFKKPLESVESLKRLVNWLR